MWGLHRATYCCISSIRRRVSQGTSRWRLICSCDWERECSSEWAAQSVSKLHPQLAPMDMAHVTRDELVRGARDLIRPTSPQGGLNIRLLEVTRHLARMSHLLVLRPKTLAQCGRDSQGYQHNDQHQHRSRDETRCHARQGLLVRGQASAIAPRQRSGDEEYIAWKVLPAECPRDK